MTDLFSSPVLVVDQPRRAPSARSRYKVTDGNGTLLAKAEERDVSLLRQASRMVWGGSHSRRVVHVEDGRGVPLMIVDSAEHFVGDARVSTPDGAPIGSLTTTKKTYEYSLNDAYGRPVGRLNGNRIGRKFAVLDAHGAHVAQIDKKWKGLATEVLLSADKYSVQIFQPLYGPLRMLVPASVIAIDVMLHESKNWDG